MSDLTRQESREMRDLGRRALERAAAAGAARATSMSREFMAVTRTYADGRVDLDKGSAAHPMPLLGVRVTTACAGVKAGDVVVVDTYGHVPLVTAVISTVLPPSSASASDLSSLRGTVSSIQSSLSTTNSNVKSVTSRVSSLEGRNNLRSFSFSGANDSARWVKLGTWSNSNDSNSCQIDVWTGNGYNGLVDQNSALHIFVKNGWQSSLSATTAFGVTVTLDQCTTANAKVKVVASAHNKCDVWCYLGWGYWTGRYDFIGQGSWDHSGANQAGEPGGTAQAVSYVPGGLTVGSGLKFSGGTLSVDNGAYVTLKTEGSDGYCAYRRFGGLVCVVCDYLTVSAKTTKTLGTLPAGYRPKKTVLGMGYPRGTNSCGQITVDTAGRVQVYSYETSSGYFGGSVTFPLP